MKKNILLLLNMFFAVCLFSQTPIFNNTITINQTYTTQTEIFPFNGSQIYGCGANGKITFHDEKANVKIILRDETSIDYLVFETNNYLESQTSFTFNAECEETCYLNGLKPTSIEIQIRNASLTLENLNWSSNYKTDAIALQNNVKAAKVNEKIKKMQDFVAQEQLIWQAGETRFTKMSYDEKKEHYKCCIINPAYEYFVAGFFSLTNPSNIEVNYDYVDNFDWRNRHAANDPTSGYFDGNYDESGWITSAKCQDGCWVNGILDCSIPSWECTGEEDVWEGAGTCWAFGPTSHVEAMVNLYLNYHVDVDLSEQNIVSCSYDTPHAEPGVAYRSYDYYKNEGVVDEECFPYSALNDPCEDKCPSTINPNNPVEQIKISNWTEISSPTMEYLRQSIIQAPVSAQMMNPEGTQWTHSMILVGWDIIEWDDIDILGIPIDPTVFNQYVGCTYWIYKNSYGNYNNNGYEYMIHINDDTPTIYKINTFSPNFVSSTINTFNQDDVLCNDYDLDGYFNWGIGPKPPYPQCPTCPDEPDGNDNNPGLGPMNQFGYCTIIDTYTSDFEITMNNWKQSSEDNCDWYRWSGPGPNYQQDPTKPNNTTGPAGTPDGSDYYLYMNTSYCGIVSESIIESPPINFTDPGCAIEVTFAYHKDNQTWENDDIDDSKLSIDISYDNGTTWFNDFWYIIGDQNDEWHYVTVYLPDVVNRFRFRSDVGSVTSWYNDMALDDITISPANFGDIVISSDETWDESGYYMCENIIVEPNASLTISNGATVLMNEGKKIIVKRAGKLVVDSATITSTTNQCWEGIEVWGNSLTTQYPTAQGWVLCRNDSKIKNSVMGIYTNRPDPEPESESWMPNYTGGIVQVFKTEFENNTAAIQFFPYEENSVSIIEDSEFFINDNYFGQDEPENMVSINGMVEVPIKNSLFLNNSSNNQKYCGIRSINSKISVNGECNPPFDFPDPPDPCIRFKNFEYGIHATATSSSRFVTINNLTFKSNYRGVYIGGMTAPQITLNTFLINNLPGTNGCGLYLDASTGYLVEGNLFKLESEPHAGGIGIIVNESLHEPNEIYRNKLIDLDYGIIAQGVNRHKDGTGLVLKCNQYDGTDMDKSITYEEYSPDVGIATSQGVLSEQPQADEMAGNLFQIDDEYPNGDFDDMLNEANSINYYYPENFDAFYENVVPVDFTENTITDVDVFFISGDWDFDEGCPDNINPGGGGSVGAEDEMRLGLDEANQDITTTETILTGLVDGGNTTELNTDVAKSIPPQSSVIYYEVMGESPYISNTVVETAIEKEDVLYNGMVRDIMVANPHSSKNEELINKLDERAQPMPAYMKGQILLGRQTVSMKEDLEAKLADHKLKKARAFNWLTRFYLNDTINLLASSDSLLFLFQNDNTINAKYKQAFLHLEKGDYQAGVEVLDDIPNTFFNNGYDPAPHENMVNYYSIIGDQNSGSLIELNPGQVQDLKNLEIEGGGIAWVYARNILLSLNEIEYEEPVILPNLAKSTEAYEEYSELIETDPPDKMEVYPNPSDDYVIIKYNLELETNNALIEINDITGKSIQTINDIYLRNQVELNTQDWLAGTYIASLKISGIIKESIKFTIIK